MLKLEESWLSGLNREKIDMTFFSGKWKVFRLHSSPRQLFFGAMPWSSINEKNYFIRMSNLKGHKPPFWSVSTLVKPFNYFLYGIFDHGWYKFRLKYLCLCFVFCKTTVPDPTSRYLWVHKKLIYIIV